MIRRVKCFEIKISNICGQNKNPFFKKKNVYSRKKLNIQIDIFQSFKTVIFAKSIVTVEVFHSLSQYRKLVETSHFVSKCNTAIYFSWCLIQALAQPVQLFWHWALLASLLATAWQTQTYNYLQRQNKTERERHLYNTNKSHKHYFVTLTDAISC